MSKTFMYFGYGSNLLRERIRIRNPSAVFLNIARLQDYRLGFDYYSGSWKGAVAGIFQSPGDHVWGCVWQLGVDDMPNLDRQERVSDGAYKPISISVVTPGGEELTCRSYQLMKVGHDDPRPSPQYLGVILKGAKQNNLPQEYQDKLAQIEHNGYCGDVKIMEEIEKK